MNELLFKIRLEQIITRREAMIITNKRSEYNHESPTYNEWEINELNDELQELKQEILAYLEEEKRRQAPRREKR